jgi:hypothetical protein
MVPALVPDRAVRVTQETCNGNQVVTRAGRIFRGIVTGFPEGAFYVFRGELPGLGGLPRELKDKQYGQYKGGAPSEHIRCFGW